MPSAPEVTLKMQRNEQTATSIYAQWGTRVSLGMGFGYLLPTFRGSKIKDEGDVWNRDIGIEAKVY